MLGPSLCMKKKIRVPPGVLGGMRAVVTTIKETKSATKNIFRNFLFSF